MSDDSALTQINSITHVQGFRGEPTASDRQRDETKKANEAMEKKTALINKQALEKREKYSRSMIGFEDRKRHGACLGLEILVKKLSREDKGAQGARVADALKLCQRHLDDISQAQLEKAKGYDKPLDAIAEKAGKALTKLFPAGTFANEAEATSWATQYLPMTEARLQQTRNIDRRGKRNRTIAKLNCSFWEAFSKGVQAGTGSVTTDTEQDVITSGMDRLAD